MITELIYKRVYDAVQSEIKLSDNWVTESKTEDATDARYILCGYLRQSGLSSLQIQQLTGLRKSTVNKILAGVKDRIGRRKITKIWWLQIGHKLNTDNDVEKGFGEYLCG